MNVLAEPSLPPALETAAMWSDSEVAGAGIEVHDVPLVSVGGGIGSFVTVDYLRIAGGLTPVDIRVLSRQRRAWQAYKHLATVSQIPRRGRIRSDASSRPDNIWGFPSYAWQEAIRDWNPGPVFQVLVEPVLADYYTPRLQDVVDSLDREARRIGYDEMLVLGNVEVVRKRLGGGYFTVLRPECAGSPRDGRPPAAPVVYRSRDVHLAVGYPGLRFLPDLQRFRERHDFHHVVNAYEDHEHIYQALRRRPGTVLVRGAGIVASQVLERLIRDRREGGSATRILHLFRTYVADTHGPHMWARRHGKDGFAYQGFNYPKSVWGGQLRARMHDLEGPERVRAYEEIEGTTTPWRQHWQNQLDRARQEGWYQSLNGVIGDLTWEQGAVVARLDRPDEPHSAALVRADYVIDCTGLIGEVEEHHVLRDLLEHGGAARNPLGRLDVDQRFRLRGAENGDGRVYVTGAAAYGGYFPGVDTFLGLQIAAQEIVDDLAERRHCRYFGPLRSFAEWLKWLTGRQI
ncbi:hypothetical protein [Allorhizocola rhizosphaerae]|uniref:hypothetical protein n=1 Tax=Allorhizocola rhizosphaerae TaxID=1872709 RepID=UPI000E3C92FB|nr:hypothetical protein [Allorhizocola rhizosphaerae]